MFDSDNLPDTSNWNRSKLPNRSSLVNDERRKSRRMELMRTSILTVREENENPNEENQNDTDEDIGHQLAVFS